MLDFAPVRARRFTIALIVAVCVGGPIVALFDQWDNTAQERRDTEADAVVIALCVGLGLTLAGAVLQRVREVSGAVEAIHRRLG